MVFFGNVLECGDGKNVFVRLHRFDLILIRRRQHFFHIIPDALGRKLKEGFLSGPEMEKLHRRILRTVDSDLLIIIHRVADQ